MARESGELVGNRAVFDFNLAVLEEHFRLSRLDEQRRQVEYDFPEFATTLTD